MPFQNLTSSTLFDMTTGTVGEDYGAPEDSMLWSAGHEENWDTLLNLMIGPQQTACDADFEAMTTRG